MCSYQLKYFNFVYVIKRLNVKLSCVHSHDCMFCRILRNIAACREADGLTFTFVCDVTVSMADYEQPTGPHPTNQPINKQTLWTRFLLQKLIFPQLLNKFRILWNQNFIETFTSAWLLSQSWCRLSESTVSHRIS